MEAVGHGLALLSDLQLSQGGRVKCRVQGLESLFEGALHCIGHYGYSNIVNLEYIRTLRFVIIPWMIYSVCGGDGGVGRL